MQVRYLFILLIFIPLSYALQGLIRSILDVLHSSVKLKIYELKKSKKLQLTKDDGDLLQIYENHEEIRKNMSFLTKIISYMESVIIFTATIYIFSDLYITLEKTMHLLAIVAGWLTIKTIGSFGQWSDKYLGRTNFYLFLIGTAMNIILSIIIGIILLYLVKLLSPEAIYIIYY